MRYLFVVYVRVAICFDDMHYLVKHHKTFQGCVMPSMHSPRYEPASHWSAQDSTDNLL